MAKQMKYEDFVKEAAANDIPNVTQAEYDDHAPDVEGPRAYSMMTALRRIRNSRRGVGKATETLRVFGFPLGGRDFTYAGMEDEAWKQFVLILTTEGLKELDCHGTFKGTHGIRSEILYEESTTPKKAPDVGVWTNRPIKEVVIGVDRLDRAMLATRALSVDDITKEDVYKNVILKGKVSDKWGYEPEFVGGEKVGDYPLEVGKQPCLYFFIHGAAASLKVRLPPRSLSTAYIDVPDWSNALQEAISEKKGVSAMAGSFADLEVYIVGNVSRFEDVKSTKGRNYVTIIATAIVALPWQPKQVKLGEPAPAPAPIAPVATATSSTTLLLSPSTGNITFAPPAPATVVTIAPAPPAAAPVAAPAPPVDPEKAERQRKAQELTEQTKKAIRVLGPNAANKDIGVYLKQQFKVEPSETVIAIAIKRAKEQLEKEKTAPPTLSVEDLVMEYLKDHRMSPQGVTFEALVTALGKKGVSKEDVDATVMDLLDNGTIVEPRIGNLRLA